MGMYNHIDFETECPICKKTVTGFQSKDKTNDFFETFSYYEVDNFYSSCDYCNAWIEYNRKEPKPYVPIDHYAQTCTANNIPESHLLRNKITGKIAGFKGGWADEKKENE